MKVFITYIRYFDEINNVPQIGGLQTYIENLCAVTTGLGLETVIFQKSTFDFERRLPNGTNVIGKKCRNKNFTSELVAEAEKMADTENDLLIFLTSTLICKTKFRKTIAIQHGIYWDIQTIHGKTVKFPFDVILRSLQTMQEIRKICSVQRFICVDYNYINWLRAVSTRRNLKYRAIPNFAEMAERVHIPEKEQIRVVFARRFDEIRGVGLICEFMPKILAEHENVHFTIAGRGGMSELLHQTFDKFPNVSFTTYQPSESLEFHREFDVALVPSIGSEGTSLSLIEAMSSGCAVICSDVGGLSNLVLDGFNGRIVRPDAEDFYQALSEMIEDRELIRRYAAAGRETVEKSLSRDIWESKWKEVLSEMM